MSQEFRNGKVLGIEIDLLKEGIVSLIHSLSFWDRTAIDCRF